MACPSLSSPPCPPLLSLPFLHFNGFADGPLEREREREEEAQFISKYMSKIDDSLRTRIFVLAAFSFLLSFLLPSSSSLSTSSFSVSSLTSLSLSLSHIPPSEGFLPIVNFTFPPLSSHLTVDSFSPLPHIHTNTTHRHLTYTNHSGSLLSHILQRTTNLTHQNWDFNSSSFYTFPHGT